MTDKTLQARVEDELEWEPSVDSSNIGVAVDAGVVRLSGPFAPTRRKSPPRRRPSA